MKNSNLYNKLVLMVLLGTWFNTSHAQFKRYVIYENFTNTSCGPCAAGNPKLEAVVTNNPGKVHNIAYHVDWPSKTDPMFTPNPSEITAIYRYYGVHKVGVPYVALDGNKWTGNSASVVQSQVDTYYSATASSLGIKVAETKNGTNRTVDVEVFTGTTTPTGNLKLKVAVVEKKISYTSAPGSNGEKVFHNVFRDLINVGDTAGEAFTPAPSGSSVKFNYNYSVKSTWQDAEIYVIAYVYNKTTKEVINSGSSLDQSATSISDDEANESLSKAYPNPATDYTTIPVKIKGQNAALELTDLCGRAIKHISLPQGEQNFKLNLSGISAGTYIYRVINDKTPSKAMLLQVDDNLR